MTAVVVILKTLGAPPMPAAAGGGAGLKPRRAPTKPEPVPICAHGGRRSRRFSERPSAKRLARASCRDERAASGRSTVRRFALSTARSRLTACVRATPTSRRDARAGAAGAARVRQRRRAGRGTLDARPTPFRPPRGAARRRACSAPQEQLAGILGERQPASPERGPAPARTARPRARDGGARRRSSVACAHSRRCRASSSARRGARRGIRA